MMDDIDASAATDADRQAVLDAAMKVMPEGHLPTDVILLVAHRQFDADRETDTYYTIVNTPMAPHEMRGFMETMVERSSEIFGW
jgi:hypothetical protein